MAIPPEQPKQFLMMKYDAGELTEIPPSVNNFHSETITIAVDELNDTVWVWQGSLMPLVQRRACLNPASSMKRAGRHYKGMTIGFNLNNLEVIYERNLEDPDLQKKFELLKETVLKTKTTDGVLAIIDLSPQHVVGSTMETDVQKEAVASLETPEAVQPSPAPVETPTAPAAPTPPPPTPVEAPPPVAYVPPTPASEDVVPEPVQEEIQEDLEDLPEPEALTPAPLKLETTSDTVSVDIDVKIGLLLNSILEFFPEIYIARHQDTIAVEGNEGTLTTFKILDTEIEVSSDFDFLGKRESVLNRYKDLINKM